MKPYLFSLSGFASSCKRHFRSFYRLFWVATAITTSVFVGSMLIGDSIRATLERKVSERLGDTETLMVATGAMFDSAFVNHPVFDHRANGVLISRGFIPHNGRMIPVMVWGTTHMDIRSGEACGNERLVDEIGIKEGAEIVLRLPANELIPSGSLFVTDQYTTSLRLTHRRTIDRSEGGNRMLANEQITPVNLFINREELANALGIGGKINLILHPKRLSLDSIQTAWSPFAMGLHKTTRLSESEITSDRIFLPQSLVDLTLGIDSTVNRLFSYLINNLTVTPVPSNDSIRQIPYSFVTALDRYDGRKLASDEIILSDYAAKRMNAKKGDSIQLRFFSSEEMKVLTEESITLSVSGIVSLETWHSDSTLSAKFPGLSNVESCTDWNSDLPIDMKRVSKEDERYWDLYRTTPKAIISYEAIKNRWPNRYGSATSLRISTDRIAKIIDGIEQNSTFDMFGIQVVYPRETALIAARNGVDFTSLFFSLGFFIIVGAVLLIYLPIQEMIHRREATEFPLLRSIGFADSRICRLLFRESIPPLLAGVGSGTIGGIIYAQLILWLLATLWQGATHADNLTLSPSPSALAIGTFSSLITALSVLWLSIRTIGKGKKRQLSRVNKLAKSSLFSFNRLVLETIRHDKRGTITSFITLLLGVMIVFMVGLHRADYSTAGKHTSATGGFTHWCETSVPLYHSLSTPEGREKLGLKELNNASSIVQLWREKADDASCLNLNKPQKPSIIGIDFSVLNDNPFILSPQLSPASRMPEQIADDTATTLYYPIVVDETVLTWSLGKSVGDTIRYPLSADRTIVLKVVASLSNSIFQGNLLMPIESFRALVPETAGSTLFLMKVAPEESVAAIQLLETALYNYGITAQPTIERLAAFNSVTDTYLSIFMTLGGLGLLIGVIAFVVVVRKNLTMRGTETNLYRSLGFSEERISALLYRENLLVPLSAIACGIAISVLSLGTGITRVDWSLWGLAAGFGLLFIAVPLVFIKEEIRRTLTDTESK